MWHDERLSKFSNQENKFGTYCCSSGTRNRAPIPRTQSPYLRNLFYLDTPQAQHFRENVNSFNSKFAWVSLKSGFDPRKQGNRRRYCFKVCFTYLFIIRFVVLVTQLIICFNNVTLGWRTGISSLWSNAYWAKCGTNGSSNLFPRQ